MKKDIHPKYHECSVKCVCGNEFTTRSTLDEISVEICSACHPFFTGQQKLVDSAGRVDRFLKKYGSEAPFHVTEIYSPPRVVKMAKKMGLVPGLSLDLTTIDEDDGQPWDFSKKEKRDKARDLVRNKKHLLLVLSPMCTAFSILQRMNYPKLDPQEVEKYMKDATTHLEFCMDLCEIQTEQGMYFLFEHPWTATSWKNVKVK